MYTENFVDLNCMKGSARKEFHWIHLSLLNNNKEFVNFTRKRGRWGGWGEERRRGGKEENEEDEGKRGEEEEKRKRKKRGGVIRKERGRRRRRTRYEEKGKVEEGENGEGKELESDK